MLNVLKNAAILGGEVLLKYFQKDLVANLKNNNHKIIVTKADIEAQKIIKDSLIQELTKKGIKESEIGFIGEENLHTHGIHKFIIDPLDGTSNFSAGLPYFAVSIGYYYKDQPVAGLIYCPTTKDLIWTEIGKGAYKNGEKLILKYKPLKDSLINVYYNSPTLIYKKQFELYKKIYPHVRGLRTLGCFVLDVVSVAENIFSLHINGHAYVWDLCAAKMIVEEAGGIAVDWAGNKIKIDPNDPSRQYQGIIGHPTAVCEILKYFK